MTITLGESVLCAGQERNSTGDPVGPADLRVEALPGVAVREYVGADRIQPEHIRSDSGSVAFGVARTFADVDAALAYIGGAFLREASEGELKIDGNRVFGLKSVVTRRVAAHVGCTVYVNYAISG